MPIRAAPSGVTSIHIGIRPRLHPSRADSSLELNQPDPTCSEPLFTPLAPSRAVNLPSPSLSPSVQGSHQQRLSNTLADKAREQYEEWKAKKAEREGEVAKEDSYGTRDWVPRQREPARPVLPSSSSVSVPVWYQAPQFHTENDRLNPAETPINVVPTPVGVSGMYADIPSGQPRYPQQMYDGQFFDPQAYYPNAQWDPMLWWGMMPGYQDLGQEANMAYVKQLLTYSVLQLCNRMLVSSIRTMC